MSITLPEVDIAGAAGRLGEAISIPTVSSEDAGPALSASAIPPVPGGSYPLAHRAMEKRP